MTQKNVSEYYSRFAELCEIAGKTVTGAARELGKADSFFFTYRSPKRGFGDKVLIELEKKFGFNPEYIRRGAEPKFTGDVLYGTDVTNDYATEETEIKLYNAPAHANLGAFVSLDALPRTTIKYSRDMVNKNTRAIRINGDSLIEAGIYGGDIAFFDIVDADFKPVSGQMIIVDLNGCLLIKYASYNKGRLELASANKNARAISEEIDDNLRIIGLVREIRRYV